QPEQLEVLRLEGERQRLGERVAWDAGEQRAVHLVEREQLLDVVAHLVDRDVVALVVHATRRDAGTQVRKGASPGGWKRVPGAARGVDDDALGEPRCLRRREA